MAVISFLRQGCALLASGLCCKHISEPGTGNRQGGFPLSPGFLSRFRVGAAALAVSAVAASAPGERAWAQTAVCSNTPGEGQRVECVNENTNPIEIELDGVDISTTENDVSGVLLKKESAGSGAIELSVVGSSIGNTASSTVSALQISHGSSGDIRLGIRDSSIANLGENTSYAIHVVTTNPASSSTGVIDIQLDRASLVSAGEDSLHVVQSHSGDVRIRARDSTFSSTGSSGRGIFAYKLGSGILEIAIEGGSIETAGDTGAGILARSDGSDPIEITVDSVTIETAGTEPDLTSFPNNSRTYDGSHGIAAEQRGSGSVDISVRGGSTTVSGADQHGIAVGGISADGLTLYTTSARDEAGYRRQTVTVDGPVQGGSGIGAGVYLAGGGRVIIGPDGRVGSLAGTAIRSAMRTGQAEADDPKLYVDLRPGDRRRVSDLLDGAIVNEGGASYTTVAVNGVVLMDAGTVADSVWAPNGLREVALRAGADGANIAVADFLDRWTPRAAVYEALPGVLLRLDEAGGGGAGGPDGRLRAPESPLWLRVSGGLGSYKAKDATVGARYRFSRYAAEAGADFRLGDDLTGWFGARLVSGSARVSAANRGGKISALGYGLSAGLAWLDEDSGWYAEGRASLTRYSANLSSAARGSLKKGARALAHSLGLEGGRRFGLDGGARLTARAWLNRSGVSMGRVTDAVGDRVSVGGSNRFRIGAGVVAETGALPVDGADGLTLHGALGAEQTLGGETEMTVSGEKLKSEAKATRLNLGAGGTWRADGFTLRGTLAADGLVSNDSAYTARIGLHVAF